MIKNKLLLFGFLVGVGAKIGSAYGSELPTSAINAEAVNTKRLFFSETQRRKDARETSVVISEIPVKQSDLSESRKNTERSLESRSNILRYTGVIKSIRGMQIMLNGLPWRSGDFDVTSARLQMGSHLLEVTLVTGKRYRLAPGESIELAQ